MTPEELISRATGRPFRLAETSAIGGGCISSAFILADGDRCFFIKRNRPAFLDLFEAESEALGIISKTNTLRVPQPLGAGCDRQGAYLVLEFLPLRSLDRLGHQKLGRSLAKMHRHVESRFGWAMDNAIGATSQRNGWCDSWVEFFAEHRLRFQFELATKNGLAVPHWMSLVDGLPRLLEGHEPPASLLHGDLWSGNAAMMDESLPVVFDPASYHGDRETDLAFTKLFGGFPPEFQRAYEQEYPLPEGAGEREPIYNIYHVLNHFNLFGGGYGAEAMQITARIVARLGCL